MNPDPSLTPEDAELKAQIDAINKKEKKKPKHCGDFLDEPPYEREINHFCGLKNQGATCYLNSLIQLLYMAPELRNTILSLPLCKETLEEPTDFVPANSAKYKILMALQKLFSEMQDLNIKSLTTENVTESFGWQQNQAMVQQDIQEASRVIFDVLERALTGTGFAESIPRLYKGTLVNHLQCLNCQLIKEREESFYDLILQVKNCASIEESLLNLLNIEKLEGPNQYFCENCNKKVDADKGMKIRKFPPILMLSLSRFEYDFSKDELKKLNDSVRFGLELDISMFSEKPELYENENDRIYELAGVLIHSGSPYSGHYHAYIRDLLKEGDWKNKFQALKEKARLEKEKKAAAEGATAGEGEKKEGDEIAKEKGLEDQSTDEEEKDTTEEKALKDIEASLGQNPSQSNFLSQNFKVIKKKGKNAKNNINKKNKIKKKKIGGANTNKSNKKDKKKDDDEDEEEFDDTILDDVAFPVGYSNPELAYDWFDFNDATVSPIPVNRLQIQFGGSFSENGYILVYRQKSLANNPEFKKINVQQYMVKSIETQNEAMEAVRAVYREAEAHLEVVTLYPELLNMHERKFPHLINLVENGNKLRVKFEDKVSTIFGQIKDQNPKEIALVEVQVLPSDLVQFKRLLDENSFDQKISDLKIECWSTWLIFRKDDPVFIKEVLPYCGESFVPMRVNLRSPQFMDATVITHENTILLDFRQLIAEACGVPLEYQQLLLMEGEAPKMLNTKEEENLEEIKKLGITDNSDVLVNASDPEELKMQQETSSKGKKKLGMDSHVSVTVERDDDKSTVKYYIDLDWTLDDLIKNIKKKLNIPLDSERRLKKVKGNVLFYEEDITKKLRDLGFEDLMKICLEKGKIPQLGSFLLRVRNQSKYKKPSDPNDLDITVSPNETLQDLKRRICMDIDLIPKNHRLFQTDWLDEPVQLFGNEDKTVRDAPLKPGEVIVLRDRDNPIPRDVIKLNLYQTKTGFHSDSEYVGIIQGREDQTLMELKSMIMIMPQFSSDNQDIGLGHIRVREMRHGFFGTVFNDEAATLKTMKFESNMSIVVQVLDKPEQLTNTAIVLLLKKRLVEYRTYTNYEEFVFEASKAPTVEEFKKAVIAFKKLDIGLEDIELAQYHPDDFEWLHVCKEFSDQERKKKKIKVQSKNKSKKPRMVTVDTSNEPEDLKEAPYWLRDGDIVAYRLEADNPFKNDDFQTIEDEENRRRFKEGGDDTKSNAHKNNHVGGFQIYTDF